jgi:hypothetical protein
MRVEAFVLIVGLAGALIIDGCSQRTQENAQRTAQSAASDTAVAANRAEDAARDAANNLGDKLDTAADKAADKTGDVIAATGKKIEEGGERAKQELKDTSRKGD